MSKWWNARAAGMASFILHFAICILIQYDGTGAMDNSAAHRKSIAAYGEACRYLPGGVNSPVRAFGGVDVEPLFVARARGSRIFDIDGNAYLDYVGSWGPMILGHAHPAVIEAVRQAAERGTSFGAPTLAETELATRIVHAFDSIDKLRLLSSGTEALMTAIRLARAHTGRDLIVKMAGCYHGHSDSLLAVAGSGIAERGTVQKIKDQRSRIKMAESPQGGDDFHNSAFPAFPLDIGRGVPSSPGVPEAIANLTIVVPYNDIEALQRTFEKHAGRIAAVLVEPVAANMGVVEAVPGYLQALRSLCDDNGTVLVFDEVISGFRVAFGGAQQRYRVHADITCLGKIVGGGLPLAACGGRAEIMDRLAPEGHVYQAGTLSGNPLATAAANATLRILSQEAPSGTASERIKNQRSKVKMAESAHGGDDFLNLDMGPSHFDFPAGDPYAALESSAAALEAGLAQAATEAGVAVTINRVGSIMSCFFTDRAVRSFEDVQATDIPAFKRFFSEMLARGIYLAPSAYEAMFVSLAHTKGDIGRTVEAARESFNVVARA